MGLSDLRRQVKTALYRLGVGPAAERLYFNLKTATPRVIINEMRVRFLRRETQPIPPGALIYDVIACRWADVYLESGKLLTRDILDTLSDAGYSPERGHKVLDFGCGCGRIARHLIASTEAQIFGTDYNPDLATWCHGHLLGGTFHRNELEPPLRYEDKAFNLVVARSVFTHLTDEMQVRWMAEMKRVIQPGGILYLSMHGPLLAGGLSAEQKARFESGELVVIYERDAGANLCSSFANQAFVENRLLDGFELVRYRPGRPVAHLRQDAYILKKR